MDVSTYLTTRLKSLPTLVDSSSKWIIFNFLKVIALGFHFEMTAQLPKRITYPLRNQVAWQECKNIWQNEIVLLGQTNNMTTPRMADLRHRLRQHNLFLRFPKSGVMRAFLRQSQWASLEPAIVGPTFCAVSRCDPSKLRDALQTLKAERQIILLGGKALDTQFTIEGMEELVMRVPSFELMRAELVSLLQSPAAAFTQTTFAAPIALTSSLKQHLVTNFSSSWVEI